MRCPFSVCDLNQKSRSQRKGQVYALGCHRASCEKGTARSDSSDRGIISPEHRGDNMNETAVVLSIIGVVLSAITIFAIYYGPISALKIQRELDEEREARNRKLKIFK